MGSNHSSACLAVLLAALGLLLPTNGSAAMSVVTGAPAGFESLEAPRHTVVSLYYGGEFLGNMPAVFTPSMVSFTDPQKITDAIPTLIDPAAIGAALATALPAHPELLCGAKPQEGCGRLKPDLVGVIFDENHLTAELFINRQYLSVSETGERYLPLPERHFSSVYRFNGAISGAQQTNPNFALSSDAVHAFGEGNLTTETSVSNRGLRFDQASAGVERQGWSAAGGLMRSQALQLAGDRDIAGVSLGTSMRTRLDARKTEGNDLIVYLPRQSFVSIYREGRLYSSRQYDAGNQRLDTSELPNGAYNVTLKIQEAGGETREETRFFAKSEQIPPPDAPSYYLQGGVVRKPASQDDLVPQLTSKPLVEVGTVRRVDDNVGLSVGALGLSDRVAMESSLFMVADSTQLRATALASSAGDVGVQANLLYIKPRWNAALDARKLWSGQAMSEDYAGLLASIEQASGSITYNVSEDVDFTVRASYVAQDDMPTSTSLGPEVNWRLWQQGESLLTFAADAAHVDGRDQATMFIRFSYRLGDNGITGEAGASHGGNNSGMYGSTRVWHNKVAPDDTLLIGAGTQDDSRTQTVSADADWRSHLGRVSGAIQHGFGEGAGTSYGGNFAIGAAQSSDMVQLGGTETDMSAVAIETSGDADTALTIFVNSTPHGTMKVGERHVIYLPPYNVYNIRLVPTKRGMFEVEGGERKVTLYPGNVSELKWEVNSFVVVTARLIHADGTPLANATLSESRSNVATDGQGRFQAELTHPGTLTFTDAQNQICHVTLPAMNAVNGVMLYPQPLRCE